MRVKRGAGSVWAPPRVPGAWQRFGGWGGCGGCPRSSRNGCRDRSSFPDGSGHPKATRGSAVSLFGPKSTAAAPNWPAPRSTPLVPGNDQPWPPKPARHGRKRQDVKDARKIPKTKYSGRSFQYIAYINNIS